MHGLMRILGIAALFFIVACGRSDAPAPSEIRPSRPPIPSPGAPSPVKGEGTIVGEVLFKGVPPAPKRIVVNKDKEACGDYQDSEELVVGPNKGVRWAVVSLDSSPVDMRWEGTTLDQQGCRFSPHVRLIPAGSKLMVLNPDGVLHNFHSQSSVNPSVNKAQPKFKKTMEVSFEKPEIFRISCDAHGWMRGWIAVIDHPWHAVTDEKGGFKFENVPAGKRVFRIWHEGVARGAVEVEVRFGETTKVSFELK